MIAAWGMRVAATLAVAATSFLVSYGFFQEALAGSMKRLAFAVSPEDRPQDEVKNDRPSASVALRADVGRVAFGIGEALDGPAILSTHAWLRVALPCVVGTALVVGTSTVLGLGTARGRRALADDTRLKTATGPTSPSWRPHDRRGRLVPPPRVTTDRRSRASTDDGGCD